MIKEFERSDLDPLSDFLRTEFNATENGIVMHHTQYATDLLKKLTCLSATSLSHELHLD